MKKFLYFPFLFFSGLLFAQEVSLEEAFQIALQNNWNTKILQNNLQIASNNNFAGNTGKLPRITLNVADNFQLFGINQQLSNGTEISRNGAVSNNLNANIRADWQIFNGGRIWALQERLQIVEKNTEIALKNQKQQLLAQVAAAYLEIVRQKQNLKLQQTLLSITQERLKIIQKRVEVGTANQTDLSLAQLDVSNQEQVIRSQELALKQAKINLNLLLAQNPDTPLEVKENVTLKEKLQLESLKSSLEQNPQLEIARNNLKNSLTFEKEAKAQKMPSLTISAGYSYNRNNSTAGFLLLNQNYGAFVGFNLAVPLYNGDIFNRQYQTAQLQTKSQELEYNRIRQELQTELERQWQNYLIAQEQYQIETISSQNAQEYLKIMDKRFSLGQATIIEIREAQRVAEISENRKIQSFFNVKLAEIQLLLVAGNIDTP
ncbi:TolC family protein [Raineya orbicola]|jgi:outer membrane protein TolC|uniref:Outer membrane efflux protein n=1 Tax=Raineya orbicola TaxID=2016530 RepID=A0A2N3I794_9BACT|nr:TolC family protein [Raineya orbicola]PKQ66169.1 Outer membrane efflux protein [Raineya orbicola]